MFDEGNLLKKYIEKKNRKAQDINIKLYGHNDVLFSYHDSLTLQ